MNTELLKTWIDRLKHGNHEQCTRYLSTKDNCFCAVGVLVDASNKGEWQTVSNSSLCREYYFDETISYPVSSDVYVDEIKVLLDCSNEDASRLFSTLYAAVEMNELGKPHKQIGKYLEKILKSDGLLAKRVYTKKG